MYSTAKAYRKNTVTFIRNKVSLDGAGTMDRDERRKGGGVEMGEIWNVRAAQKQSVN